MNIVVCCKVVPDDQDIQVAADGTLDYSKAKPIVSAYDLNAIEAAAQLADGGRVVAVTAGPADIDDSKLKKNILARGVDELYMTADDACKGLDAHGTAAALADLVGKVGGFDVILCGDGSADNYAQQVDVQLAARLGLPSVNGATKIEAGSGSVTVERTLEDVVEVVEAPLPCVVSVAPDIALPRIPGMKGRGRRRRRLRERPRGPVLQGPRAGRAQARGHGRLRGRGDREVRGGPQSGPVVERWNHNESTRYR